MIFNFITTPPPAKKPIRKTLLDAHGVKVGRSIEWAHGNTSGELTADERAALMECCGWKKVHEWKALAVKSLMATKSCAQIVHHFRARKGMKESTVKNIHRALSKAAGERFSGM